jgi:hypothetical protein
LGNRGLTYRQLAWSIENGAPLICAYAETSRAFCPITLGYNEDGTEVARVWQTDGASSGPLPDWRTFYLSKITGVQRSSGEWRTGSAKGQKRPTMIVDYDANPASPYSPTRSLGDLLGTPFPT